ncbi:flagellar biosynthesis repressor FlbT [Hyphomicrobium sp. CS1GBMeth3]|uniref:flagellar biosynthesis repressor FlbT n=1 Tax=Hyphomicrobium sp. CS1GBMeth3 TaxID=1892845 RepID=UPI0009305B44|nr:flagellar biosynthesis repressor FlbT [Hyphomicrobium sp. CS1GBMeth3]
MSTTTRITLRPGERMFINGAVLKAEGRMSFEILNDVPYLVENEILHAQQTTTPLRQLYYILQTMVMEPTGMEMTREVYEDTMRILPEAFANEVVLAGLATIRDQVTQGSPFAAMKTLRALIPIEDQILGRDRMADLKVVGAGA